MAVVSTSEPAMAETLTGRTSPRAEIVESAKSRLRSAPYSSLSNVTCDFSHGVLTLQGRVSSYFLKQVAQTIVKESPGIDAINNRIEVRPGLRARAERQSNLQ